ncbi:MAG: hypothetical protein Q9179_007485 [Wetmoreana sp. 5 TL-2023]
MAGIKRKYDAIQSSLSSKPVEKQKLSPPSKPFKSAEIIVDSASDNEILRGRTTTKKPATSSTKVSGNGSSVQLSPTRPATPKSTVPRSDLSKKRDYEIPARSSTSSSSDDSASDSDIEDQALSSPIKRREEKSDSETDSEDSDVNKEDSESDEGLEETRKQQENLESRNGSATPEPMRPPAPYNPPPGFEAARVTSALSPPSHEIFAVDNLQGKQIWHITAPASVPISSIKEVPIQKVFTGSSILSHKGAHYGLFAEADADRNEKVLLVPSHEDGNYRLAAANITKALHLQQIVKPLSLSHQSGNPATGIRTAPQTHVRAVRQQPEGLRMRYRPFGDEYSSEDSESVSQFKVPPIVAAKSPKKAKPVAENTKTSPAKQHHKPRKDSSVGKSGRDSLSSSKDQDKAPRSNVPSSVSPSQITQNAKPVAESLESLVIKERTKPRAETSTPKPKGDPSSLSMLELAWKSSFGNATNANGSKPAATNSPATDSKPKETAEEKAKRREEKKRRKQSKAVGTEDPIEAINVPQTTPLRKEPAKSALSVDDVKGTPSTRPETEQLTESKKKKKKKKRESEAMYGQEAVAINSVGNAHIKQSEPEQTKPKKKKRKSEARDDV